MASQAGPRQRRVAGLLTCVLLVLGAHLSLLLYSSRVEGREGARDALDGGAATRPKAAQIRWLKALPDTPAAALSPSTPLAEAAVPQASSSVSSALPASADAAAPALPALAALQISYPDAPAPGGRLLLRLFIKLNLDGSPATVQVNGNTQALAPFVDAAVEGLMLSLREQHGDVAAGWDKPWCLEVDFDEQGLSARSRRLAASHAQACLGRMQP